jgi:Holliday junction resolvase
MHNQHRTDSNQAGIVRALKQAGASVCDLSAVGGGCPDLVVGWNGSNYLLEVKNLEGRGLRFTPAEREFAGRWLGKIFVVCDVIEALAVLDVERD